MRHLGVYLVTIALNEHEKHKIRAESITATRVLLSANEDCPCVVDIILIGGDKITLYPHSIEEANDLEKDIWSQINATKITFLSADED